jgi:regulator of sigma E protease
MTYLLTIGLLGLLIFIHELGHLLAGQWVGIPIERFSIGFGPVLWKKRIRGVEYCLSAIPLGGYVMPKIEDEAAFFAIPVSKRIVFWLGGPAANFVSAALTLGIASWAMDGFSLNGVLVEPWVKVASLSGPLNGVLVEPWVKVASLSGQLLAVIPMLFLEPDKLSGVVGIVSAGKQVMSDGLLSTVRFAVLLNLNLAVFNLLPIAPLDGGKIFCALLEKIHPRLAKLHTGMAVVGLLLLLALMVYTTVLDVRKMV